MHVVFSFEEDARSQSRALLYYFYSLKIFSRFPDPHFSLRILFPFFCGARGINFNRAKNRKLISVIVGS